MAKAKDMTGMRFGRLTVLSRGENIKYRSQQHCAWVCECDCGNITTVAGYCLRSGHTQSCGCLGREKRLASATKHGHSESKLYLVWCGIKARCLNPQNKAFSFYGGRGITICQEWLQGFDAFYEWAINNGYKEGLSIDRIDVNGNYEPKNCRWITMKEQANNRRPRKLNKDG